MSKVDLLNYINEKYSIKLESKKIKSYQDIINASFDLNQFLIDICSEFLKKPSERDKLVSLFDALIKLNYGEAAYRLGKLYANMRSSRLASKYMLKAIQLENTEAMLYYYKHYAFLNNFKPTPLYYQNEYLELAASLNNSAALTILGTLYLEGKKGYSVDYKKAIECFEKAGEQNNPEALFSLGEIYENGIGVLKNYDKAISYYKKIEIPSDKECRTLGDSTNQYYAKKACEKLGFFYEEGKVVKQDITEAIKWFTLGSEFKSVDCSLALASYYYDGVYLDVDIKKVYKLSLKCIVPVNAIKGKFTRTKNTKLLGKMYYIHALLSKDGSIGRYKQWKVNVREENYIHFLKKSAKLGNVEAQYQLGYELYTGVIVEQDLKSAKTLLQQAEKNNHDKARYLLCEIMFKDLINVPSRSQKEDKLNQIIKMLRKILKGNNSDILTFLGKAYLEKYKLCSYNKEYVEQAIYWFTKAAELSNLEAMLNLGKIYFSPDYKVLSYQKAYDWLEKAALRGSGEAFYIIGLMYNHHEKYKKVIFFFQKAIENGYIVLPADKLGTFYEEGIGVDKDYIKAKEYYELSIKHGGKISWKLDRLIEKINNEN